MTIPLPIYIHYLLPTIFIKLGMLRYLLVCLFTLLPASNASQFLDYNFNHTLKCEQYDQLSLPDFWHTMILHSVDRYTYLSLCPFLVILQLCVLFLYCRFSHLRTQPGDILMGLNINDNYPSFIREIVYTTIYSQYGPLPDSFVNFCEINGVIAAFCTFLGLVYSIAFCVYIVNSLRTNLKHKKLNRIIMHAILYLVSGVATFACLELDLLGLNMYGVCSFVVHTYVMPILTCVGALIFISLGYFSLSYFKKHMPETQGLRFRKYQLFKKYFFYIAGLSLIQAATAALNVVAIWNCWRQYPDPGVDVVVTASNLLKLVQIAFIIYVAVDNPVYLKQAKRTIRRLFARRKLDESRKMSDSLQAQQVLQQQQLQDLMLMHDTEYSTLDSLRVSQVSTIILGIFIGHMEYYQKMSLTQDIKDHHYTESITTRFNSSALIDYKISVKNCPHIHIIEANIIIYAPKIFKNLLIQDGLAEIHKSFDLVQNYDNMFNIVQGEGGKSGEFFFFTADNKFILKTINEEELTLLTQNLSVFHDYYYDNPKSLLAKIYGLFTFHGTHIQRTFHIILMKNIIGCDRSNVERVYDMKGSSYDRMVLNPKKIYSGQQLKSMTLKDLDFLKVEGKLRIGPDQSRELRTALRQDSFFLKNLNLIDYSLLVVKVKWTRQLFPSQSNFWTPLQRLASVNQKDIFYHIGVIDYMQAWNINKKSEKWWKTLFGAKDVSAQRPDIYSTRFVQFLENILPATSRLEPFSVATEL